MADLTTESAKKGALGIHDNPGYIPPVDAVEIVFNDGSHIEGRTPGKIYTVNSGLAHHYTDVLKVARAVEKAGKPGKEKDDKPSEISDRAVAAPPRGPKH